MEVQLLLTAVTALAKLAYELCKNGKMHQEECSRISERLPALIALAQAWSDSTRGTASSVCQPNNLALVRLHEALKQLNLALQAATTPSSRWSGPVRKFLKDREAAAALTKAEKDLNVVLLDFSVHQNNVVNEQIQQRYDQLIGHLSRVEDKLNSIGQRSNCVTDGGCDKRLDAAEMNFILRKIQTEDSSSPENKQILDEAFQLQEKTMTSVQRMQQQTIESLKVGTNTLAELGDHKVQIARISKNIECLYSRWDETEALLNSESTVDDLVPSSICKRNKIVSRKSQARMETKAKKTEYSFGHRFKSDSGARKNAVMTHCPELNVHARGIKNAKVNFKNAEEACLEKLQEGDQAIMSGQPIRCFVGSDTSPRTRNPILCTSIYIH